MKKITCTITEEIVKSTTFRDLENCYAMAAMRAAGLTQDQVWDYYEKVAELPSTFGNLCFGADLFKLDKYGLSNDPTIPKLPLSFTVEIEEHE